MIDNIQSEMLPWFHFLCSAFWSSVIKHNVNKQQRCEIVLIVSSELEIFTFSKSERRIPNEACSFRNFRPLFSLAEINMT